VNLIFRMVYAPSATSGLCSTCVWGTVRRGFESGEAEVFCRLVGPNSRVRYAVKECTGYSDRRVTPEMTDTRLIGFVTEVKLT